MLLAPKHGLVKEGFLLGRAPKPIYMFSLVMQ